MSAAKKNSPERGISPISKEEFLRDFLSLPIMHRGILFVLRTGYLIKQAPLDKLDIKGLCPAVNEEEREAIKEVLGRFFVWNDPYWTNELYDNLLEELKHKQLEKDCLSKKRSSSGKKGAGSRWGNSDDKSIASAINEDGKPMANAMNEDGKPMANAINGDGKPMANAINEDGKLIANAINEDGKPMANAINGDGKSMASAINKDGKSMASAIPKEKPVELNSLKTNYFSKESGDGSESENGRQEEPRARTRAHRSDRISDINSINKNINKSESVSESDRRLKIKNLFAREKSAWMIGEVLEVLVFFGLDEKALARWRSRNPENQNFILELAAGGMSRFDYDTIAQVFARCQAAKDKEGKPLSSAVAFVLKSLQHELTAVSNRKNARQSASESAQPKRFRDIDYMEGIERLNPDGTFVLKRKMEGR
ncbi:hypothetical protein [Parasutterella excrementihominis]|uniref:hypothetical protein n=1 Tax=Parasutterella excrementihominis TaxID=487175 RepID=UPI003A92F22C